jgi:hypothetical protein
MRRAPRSLLAALAALAVGALSGACGGSTDTGGGALVGKAPLPLESAGALWLNTDEPRDWKAMLGNVVFLEFGFLR